MRFLEICFVVVADAVAVFFLRILEIDFTNND